MNHTLSDSQLEEMIKSAVNSFGPLPPDEKFSLLISALRELQESRKAAMDSEPVAWVSSESLDSRLAGIEAVTIPFVPGMDIPLFRHPVVTHNGDCDTDPFGFARRSGDLVVIDVNGDPHIKDGMPLYRHSQPASEREQVRREHAEWSQGTFGNVGPVGPLKHLSKEALEAAEQPGDLSEWADMQFLLWDAQRRAGITDEQITQAMIEKLAVNKQRSWPEPKDGEPRLHIKEQPVPERVHKWSYGLVHPENCQCIECRSARINGVKP